MNSKYTFQQIASGIILPALVLVAALTAYFILLPKFRTVGQQNDIKKAQEEELKNTQAGLSELNLLIEELEEKRDDLVSVDNVIPTAPEIPELLSNLDLISSQSGLILTSLQVTQAQTLSSSQGGESVAQFSRLEDILSKTRSIGIMEVDLKAIGSYQTVKNFLINLEQNQRLMDVQEIVFEESDEESGLQSFNLKILTYYQL